MLDNNLGNSFPSPRKEPELPIVRTHIYSSLKTPTIQPKISQNLQAIFQRSLIPLPTEDSPANTANHKAAALNDDFGLLVCEIHALFKAIYNQGVTTSPDFQKLDRFEQRLDELNLQLDDSSHTKIQRKQAKAEINEVKEAVRQTRLIAKQLETYHPLSIDFGESVAKFVDRYTNSDQPGNALLATRELTTMLNDFTSLRRNALDPLREKPTDDHIQELYNSELEDLEDVVKDWTEHFSSQTQKEIQELKRCLAGANEEDREPILRQILALDQQLASVKGQLRNRKLPDSSLQPLIQDCASIINKHQHELHKLIPKQGADNIARLEYGKEDWLSLVEKRPKEPVSWMNSTLTALANPSEWNSTVKRVFKTAVDGIMLYNNIQEISNEIQSRSTQNTKESPSFKADHFPKNPNAVSLEQKRDLPASMPPQEADNNLNFITQAPSEVKSVPIEPNLVKKHETLYSATTSLQVLHDLLAKAPLEQSQKFNELIAPLYRDAVHLANNAPFTQSAIERADWMQSVDDLLYAKTVQEQEMMQKAIKTKNQGLLKALLDSGLDPNERAFDGTSFLRTAAIEFDHAIINLLKDAGAKWRPLFDEVLEQQHDVEFLAAFAKINSPIKPNNIITEKFLKAFESAIQNNQIEDVKKCLSAIRINSSNENGETLLIKAAEHNLLELVKILITLPDIDLNKSRYVNADFPLVKAISAGNIEIVKLLLADPRVDINKLHDHEYKSYPTYTPLMRAVQLGNIEIVKLLLDHPQIDINKTNLRNVDAFAEALARGNLELVKLFLAHSQLDINRISETSPLNIATHLGHQEIINEIKLSGKDMVSETISHIKAFGHSWELEGAWRFRGVDISLEGFYPSVFAPYMKSKLFAFNQKHPDLITENDLKLISQGLNYVEKFNAQKMLSDFKAGEPIFIQSGYIHHNIIVAFFNNQLMICNKEKGSIRPIEAYEIDANQLTEKMLVQIFNTSNESEDDFNALFGEIHKEGQDLKRKAGPLLINLSAKSENDVSRWLESLPHDTMKQKVGNCCWESTETAIYATLALQKAIESNLSSSSSPSEIIEWREKCYNAFSRWEKYTKLDTIIQSLDVIKQEILINPNAKDSVREALSLVNNTYQTNPDPEIKDQDFWKQREIIQIKLNDIQLLINGNKKLSSEELTAYKISQLSG